MKKAILVHNPTAGDGDHSRKNLKKTVENAGFEVRYFSTDTPVWEDFTNKNAEVIFVAGGDGTVQKVAKVFTESGDKSLRDVPLQIVPCGTANNIAKTLKIKPAHAIKVFSNKVDFDLGKVKGIQEESFFIESIGCGIFPKLVRVMEEIEVDEKRGEIKQSLEELIKIIESYPAQEAIIIADKEEITGKFLLLELMNIRFIGPNVELAPNAETGDGKFELVTVEEDSREDLLIYIRDIKNGESPGKKIEEFADLRKVKEVRIKWEGRDVHVDDEYIDTYQGEEIYIKNQKGFLKVLLPS